MATTGKRQRQSVKETKPKPKRKKESTRNLFGMSTTTSVIIGIIIPLLLSGFLNYYAHKTWILYLPLFGVLLFIGYFGHLFIRAQSGQPATIPAEAKPMTAAKPELDMTEPIQNNTITSINQTSGFTGINTGTVNLSPLPRTLTNEQLATLKNSLTAIPNKQDAVFVYAQGDTDSQELVEQLCATLTASGCPNSNTWWAGSPIPRGISLLSRSAASDLDATAIKDAFTKAGIQFVYMRGAFIPDKSVQILVGARQ